MLPRVLGLIVIGLGLSTALPAPSQATDLTGQMLEGTTDRGSRTIMFEPAGRAWVTGWNWSGTRTSYPAHWSQQGDELCLSDPRPQSARDCFTLVQEGGALRLVDGHGRTSLSGTLSALTPPEPETRPVQYHSNYAAPHYNWVYWYPLQWGPSAAFQTTVPHWQGGQFGYAQASFPHLQGSWTGGLQWSWPRFAQTGWGHWQPQMRLPEWSRWSR